MKTLSKTTSVFTTQWNRKPFQKNRASLNSWTSRGDFGSINRLVMCVIAFVGINFTVFSQDIIVTKDAKKIEAKVLEINIDVIKYKNFNNLEGPTYTLPKSNVASIVYKNGDVEVFETDLQGKSIDLIDDGKELSKDEIAEMKHDFYEIGDDDEKMLAFFKYLDVALYDAAFYKRFKSACEQRETGRCLLGVGIGLTIFGIGEYVYGTLESNSVALTIGYASMIVGEVFTIVSIPVSASAGARKAAIKRDFEQQYFSSRRVKLSYQSQRKLNFGFTRGGVGLTLIF